jgi:murein DD-endopeptidase MepM/ murein hydrolase activator NlpD
MFKIFLIYCFSVVLLVANINEVDNKISITKKQYKDVAKQRKNVNSDIATLSNKIKTQKQSIQNIQNKLKNISDVLKLNNHKLKESTEKIAILKEKIGGEEKIKEDIESQIALLISEQYTMSLGLEQANIKTEKSLIDKQVYILIFKNTRDKILMFNEKYQKIIEKINKNKKTALLLSSFIQKQKNLQSKYKNMEKKQKSSIASLANTKKTYVKSLKEVIQDQHKLMSIIVQLSSTKQKLLNGETVEDESVSTNKDLDENNSSQNKTVDANTSLKSKLLRLSIELKKLKVGKYKNVKTIAPLKSYDVVGRFGKYYDDVYKIELFNKNVSLKPLDNNTKVVSVLNGQVAFFKRNFKNSKHIIVVKYDDNLYIAYSHLDDISSGIKIGKKVSKGEVIGRADEILNVQATQYDTYINPLQIFK